MSYGQYPDLKDVKKILVIKLRQLGDVLLTGPIFRVLKERFPNATIDAYIYEEALSMLEGHPGVDGLITYDRNWKKLRFFKRLKKEFSLWRRFRKGKYDLVINLTEGDRGAIVAKITKARVRVGFQPKGGWQKKLYTHVVKQCPSLRHTVERNLDALRCIGIFPTIEEGELFLGVGQKELIQVDRWIQSPFILIHPTSRWRFKCWPVDKMRQLTKELICRGKKIVFTSGPDPVERAMVAEIAEGLDVLNLSGQITLKELGALMHRCELLVCVDSVPLHMASALKAPVIALFGPTSEVTWGPWRNEKAKIVSKNMSCRPCYMDGCGGSKQSDCLATLNVDKVLVAIDESLHQSKCGALVGR